MEIVPKVITEEQGIEKTEDRNQGMKVRTQEKEDLISQSDVITWRHVSVKTTPRSLSLRREIALHGVGVTSKHLSIVKTRTEELWLVWDLCSVSCMCSK
jgi:hypothetical protein